MCTIGRVAGAVVGKEVDFPEFVVNLNGLENNFFISLCIQSIRYCFARYSSVALTRADPDDGYGGSVRAS